MDNMNLAKLEQLYGFRFDDEERRVLTAETDGNLLRGALDPIAKQHAFVLTVALQPLACPMCGGIICQRSAAKVWKFNGGRPESDDDYQCPLCDAQLSWHISPFGGGQWFTTR